MNNFWKHKKVFVSGGAGFVGSHIVDSLIAKGARVTVSVSPLTSEEKVLSNLKQSRSHVAIKRSNLQNSSECLEITKDQDIILHFAAMDGGSAFKKQYPAVIFRTNMQLTLNMLEAAKQNAVERLLLMSSIEVYPDHMHNPVTEADSCFEKGLHEENDGYAWSKRFSEIAAKMFSKEYNLKIAIVRAGNIYGPRDYASKQKGRVIPTFISQSLHRNKLTIIGDGTMKKSFLYVDDFVRAALNLVEEYPQCEPVNIASSSYITIRDLASLITKLTQNDKKPCFTNSTGQMNVEKIISTDKAQRIIHFTEDISLEEGLLKTIAYYKTNL